MALNPIDESNIVQPDLGSCGGITECKKIALISEAYYVEMATHNWGGPVITAAAMQINTCIPNFLIQESIMTSGNFYNKLLKKPILWEDGYVIHSDASGLGIEIDEEALIKYSSDKN